jgi:hypothetical protein
MRITLAIGENHLTVPYGTAQRDDSTNYGYVDLKANPELVPTIPEVRDWPELEALLIVLNSPTSLYRSLGCEKSFSPYMNDEVPELKVKLVSYIDIAFIDEEFNKVGASFEEMMGAYADFAQRQPFAKYVIFDPELTKTRYRDENVDGWCISVWIGGFGSDEASARSAWRTVIDVFTSFVASGWAPIPSLKGVAVGKPCLSLR